MFNPYISGPEGCLQPVRKQPEGKTILDGLLGRLGNLDSDDLIILLLLLLLAREGEGDSLWPLAAGALYLLL